MLGRDAWSVVIATVALLVYGVLQERVMTRAWGTGTDRELFPHSAFLVLCNRLLTVVVLGVHSKAFGHSFTPVAPVESYCMVSASNMLSTLCQYEALKYVSFVTQTLAKTSKALPVVLWGTVIGGKRYRAEQYIHAILITAGCSVFVLGGDITSAVADKSGTWTTYFMGVCLLLVYLAADGWTSTQQEHLFKAYGTCIREQLLYTTAFSTVYSLIATVGSGQLVPAVLFLTRHPSATLAVLGLSVMSTIIQVCISQVLQQHGALVFALMMTTRQCGSVLLSSLLFGHDLSLSQWLGVAVVFSALYHQKSGKVSSRRSTAGRLPQSRESHGGVSNPLLSKQGSHPLGAYSRGVSNPGTASAPSHHHKLVVGPGLHGGAVSGGGGHATATLTMTALQPTSAAAVVAANGPQVVTPRLHVTHARGAHTHVLSGHGVTVPLSPHAMQPAPLPPQLSLPAGFKKLWSQSSGNFHTAATQEAEQHTE